MILKFVECGLKSLLDMFACHLFSFRHAPIKLFLSDHCV